MPPDREFRARQGNEFREDREGRFLAAARPALWNTVTLRLIPKQLCILKLANVAVQAPAERAAGAQRRPARRTVACNRVLAAQRLMSQLHLFDQLAQIFLNSSRALSV